jgi:hypothetical protein
MSQSTPSSNPFVHRVLIIAFSIGVTFGAGVGHGIVKVLDQSSSQPQPTPAMQQRLFGMAEYERLKPGMTLVEVESILDRGIELESSVDSSTYIWRNPDRSSITVIFKNGRLERKTQTDLN